MSTNPYPGKGSITEAWQRGFEGRPMLAHSGSVYASAYAEGRAARKVDDIQCRRAWAEHAAKVHAWASGVMPEMEEGSFVVGWHECEYQTFLAGVRYARQ